MPGCLRAKRKITRTSHHGHIIRTYVIGRCQFWIPVCPTPTQTPIRYGNRESFVAWTIIIWNYARLNYVCYYTRPPPTFLGGFYLDKIDNYPQLSCTLHALAVFFVEVAAGTNDVRWFLRFLHDFTRNQMSCTILVCSQNIFLRRPRTTAVYWTSTFFSFKHTKALSISMKRL